jgi:hypothetical protein
MSDFNFIIHDYISQGFMGLTAILSNSGVTVYHAETGITNVSVLHSWWPYFK